MLVGTNLLAITYLLVNAMRVYLCMFGGLVVKVVFMLCLHGRLFGMLLIVR